MKKYFASKKISAAGLAACCLGVFVAPASATTKGLNLIPTPDVQPQGVLSIGIQEVNPQIDNATQLQLEYGISKRLEIAVVQGFSPPEDRLSMEYSVVQNQPYLLSVGFLGYSTRGVAPQPFIESGYYKGKEEFIVGALRSGSNTEALLGYQHTFNSHIAFSTDYQSGSENFSTVGVTFNLTPDISFNPALYRTNSAPHHTYGYAVLTYNFDFHKK